MILVELLKNYLLENDLMNNIELEKVILLNLTLSLLGNIKNIINKVSYHLIFCKA